MAEPISAGEPPKHHRLELLDVLRFVAAMMVVCCHWFFNGIHNGKVDGLDFTPLAAVARYGFLGVFLFFVISGYVVTQSASGKSAGRFVVGRGVRLFPAYWVGVCLTAIVVNIWGVEELHVTPIQFIANLTMVPGLFDQRPVDGVYWTLTVELTFYFAIFILMVLGLSRWLDRIFPAWSIVMLVVTLAAPSFTHFPYLGGVYAFFASGAIMAAIQRSGITVYRLFGLLAAIATGIMTVLPDIASSDQTGAYPASPIVGLIIILTFYVLVAGTWIPKVATMRIPLSRPISDLTYPIYLLHAYIGYTVLDQFATPNNLWLVYPLMFLGLFGAAWLLHWGIEVKLKDFWYRLFGILQGPADGLQRAVGRLRAVVPTR